LSTYQVNVAPSGVVYVYEGDKQYAAVHPNWRACGGIAEAKRRAEHLCALLNSAAAGPRANFKDMDNETN
jgi:hypothetical protein